MQFLKTADIQLGKYGIFLGDLDNLLSGSLETDIYVCPKCRKLEFYLAGDEEFFEEDAGDESQVGPFDNTVIVCPKCGAVHGQDLSECPQCGYNYSE